MRKPGPAGCVLLRNYRDNIALRELCALVTLVIHFAALNGKGELSELFFRGAFFFVPKARVASGS